MTNRKKQTSFVNIGSSSLLVIFLILCLVTFATLSLSSAQSDFNFSSRLAERKTEYYVSSNKAESVLDQIDAALSQTYASSEQTYFSSAEKNLSKLKIETDGTPVTLETNFSATTPTISYRISLNDTQSLSVVLTVLPAKSTEDGFYKITKWSVVSDAKWNGDNTLKLIK